MTRKLKDVKARLLANPRVRAAYDEMAPEYDAARAEIESRIGKADDTRAFSK